MTLRTFSRRCTSSRRCIRLPASRPSGGLALQPYGRHPSAVLRVRVRRRRSIHQRLAAAAWAMCPCPTHVRRGRRPRLQRRRPRPLPLLRLAYGERGHNLLRSSLSALGNACGSHPTCQCQAHRPLCRRCRRPRTLHGAPSGMGLLTATMTASPSGRLLLILPPTTPRWYPVDTWPQCQTPWLQRLDLPVRVK